MKKSLFNYSFRNKNFSTNSIKSPINKDIKQVMPLNNNKNEAIINNNINYPFKTLTENQYKVLQIKLAQLDLHNRLLLTINKNISNHPHQKVNDKMGNSINQSIIYNFSKYSSVRQGKANNNMSSALIGPISTKNPSRLGIINFAVKIIKSVFNSLYCLISRPQFINKHDKLIVRILYYQNNINKNPLFSNNNANSILRSEVALPHLSKEIIDSTRKGSMKEKMLSSIFGNKLYSNQIAKNVWIKNLINSLNVLPSSSEGAAEKINSKDSLNNRIINKEINSSLTTPSISIRRTGKINTYLLRKLIKTNNLDYLSTKRLNILKTTSNKLLMGKLIKILNNHNNKNVELIGTMTGKLLNPVNKNHLEKVIEGVYDPLTSLRKFTPSHTNVQAAEKAMPSSVQDGENINQYLLSKKNETDNILPKLINKINKNLINLKSQFIKNDKDTINFIYQNIIHQSSVSLLNSSAAVTNLKISRVHNLLLKLNRQLFLSRFLLNKNNPIISQGVSIKTLQYAIRILTLVINNNIKTNPIALISTNNSKQNSPSSFLSKGTYLNLTGNSALRSPLLLRKIKDIFLSHSFNKTKIQNTNILKNNIVKFKWLGIILSRIFGKNVEIQLVRLWNIGLESSITANIISKNSTNDKAQTILRKLWKKIVINKASSLSFLREKALLNSNDFVYNEFINNNSNASNNLSLINNLSKEQLINIQNNSNKIYIINNKGNLSSVLSKPLNIISKDKANLKTAQVNDFIKNLEIYNRTPLTLGKTVGISVRIAGRLAKERIKPRMTLTNIQVGSLSKSKVNYIEKFAFTNKNKKGSFTVTVRMGHARS